MGNYTKTVGFSQDEAMAFIRKHFNLLPFLMGYIEEKAEEVGSFQEGREIIIRRLEAEGAEGLGIREMPWLGCPASKKHIIRRVFPELVKKDIDAVIKWKTRKERKEFMDVTQRAPEMIMVTRIKRPPFRRGPFQPAEKAEWTIARQSPFAKPRDVMKAIASRDLPSPRPVRRSTPRAVRTAAKSGDDPGGGDDSGDGQGEPPRPSLAGGIIPPAPVHRAQYTPFTKNQQSNLSPWRAVRPGCCCMERRWAA